MISEKEFQMLSKRKSAEARVLSAYLAIRPSWGERFHQRLEAVFKSQTRALEKNIPTQERDAFYANVQAVRRFIADYQPSGQSIVIFSDDSQKWIWAKELKVPLANQARWSGKPYMLPLLEAFDEYERYGIVLVEKGRARLFTFILGQVEEEHGALAWNDVRYMKTTGRDNLRSQIKLQRTNELHVSWHLKHVVRLLAETARRRAFTRLILGGCKEAADELYRLLPLALKKRVVGRIHLPVDANEKRIEKEVYLIEQQAERNKERCLVEKLIQSDPPQNRRALGIDSILNALGKDRIHQLIYSQGLEIHGSRCTGCGYFFSHEHLMCGRCGSLAEPLPELLEALAQEVVQHGGTLEEVRGPAAERLKSVGGIGAVLKP